MDDFIFYNLNKKIYNSIYQKPDRYRHFKYLKKNSLKLIQIESKDQINKNNTHFVDISNFSRIVFIDKKMSFIQVEVGTNIEKINRCLDFYGYQKLEFKKNYTVNNLIFNKKLNSKIINFYTIDKNLNEQKLKKVELNENFLRKLKSKKKIIIKADIKIFKIQNITSSLRIIKKEKFNLVLGASSGLGNQLAYDLAKLGKNLYLVSSSIEDLKIIKKDLEINYGINVIIEEIDFSNYDYNIIDKKKFLKKYNIVENIYFIYARNFARDNILNINLKKEFFNINFVSQLTFIKICFILKKKLNIKNIVFIGSISGNLGSENNLIYGISKRSLNSLVESLYISRKTKIPKIQHYISGPLNTNMIFSKKSFIPAGSVKDFSKKIINNLNKDNLYQYFPFYWKYITFIIYLTPIKTIKWLINLLKK